MTRIAIWSPNYAPEPTGIPPLVTDAAEWLVSRGHYVDVITAVPNYPERCIHTDYQGVLSCRETRNGVHIHRSWLRARPERSFRDKALYELTVSSFALPHAIRAARKADVLVCVIPTLLAAQYSALIARALDRRLVLWVQDLVLAAAGSIGVGGKAMRVLSAVRWLERVTVRAADRVIVCSPGFHAYLTEGGADPLKIETIHNWADVDRIQPAPPISDGRPTRFLYAGNLGYTQGFETLIRAARLARDTFELEIVGAGNAAVDVRRLAASAPNVSVREPVESAAYPELLASADVHVVIQRRISAGANLPSKIATSLASGRPIVGSIDLQTPAADLLRKSGAAILVEPESPAALADAMCQLAADPDRRAAMGRRGRVFAEGHLAKEPALRTLEAAIIG